MKTIFVLKNSKIIRNGGYDRIVYLDASDFEKLERSVDEEGFIATLGRSQVKFIDTPK